MDTPEAGRKRILIVDDEPDILKAASFLARQVMMWISRRKVRKRLIL
ncbi:MAG: hypothetical protein WCV56_06635 [Candidatus Omnitrophota bacterium]